MTQTAPFQTPQQSQVQRDRKKLSQLLSWKFNITHCNPHVKGIHRTWCSSPSLLQVWVEIAVAAVGHKSGLQIVSFFPLLLVSPVCPKYSRHRGRGKGAPGHFYQRQLTHSGVNIGPHFQYLLPDVFIQSFLAKLLEGTGNSYSY